MSSLPDNKVRVRFAPSPTGFLHIGGVRTALYNWLYARGNEGRFFLRIEDTDAERSEERYTADILESLKWLGLHWDGEITYQSKRLDLYKARAQELLSRGHAYVCTCSEDEITKMRDDAIKAGKKPAYNQACRDKGLAPSTQGSYVLRLKIPEDGNITFTDLIRGPITVENKEIDDFVLFRSNGMPTYNLSVVIDDAEMNITQVIRGEDHINNTPKQIHIYRFLNQPIPEFAHLSMILGADKKKLSKRHGAVSANVYREEGYLPEALLNFLVRLGWSHGDQEVFSMDQMVELFDFSHVQKSGAVFNQEKLAWLNGVHLRSRTPESLALDLKKYYSHRLPDLNNPQLIPLIKIIQPKIKTMLELCQQLAPLITDEILRVDYQALGFGPKEWDICKSGVLEIIALFERNELGDDPTQIEAKFRQTAEKTGIKVGALVQPFRLALTGQKVSPGVFELISILPKDLVFKRFKSILHWGIV